VGGARAKTAEFLLSRCYRKKCSCKPMDWRKAYNL